MSNLKLISKPISKLSPRSGGGSGVKAAKSSTRPQNLYLKPFFVHEGQDPLKMFNWKRVNCEIKDSQGNVFFKMSSVEAPEEWSQLAVDIAASKYFRKTGVGKAGSEKSIKQMVGRVVEAITHSGMKQKYFANKKQAAVFANELTFILLSQRASFNSPVWFNAGLFQSYGINNDGSMWAWDIRNKTIFQDDSAYRHPQVSACYIQGVDDSLEGIFELAKNEALIFKYGSGTGGNFSSLRSRYENLNSGGISSGMMSFLEVFDKVAGSVKSGGTTRRAAKMVCVDVDHPEIEEFIQWKEREEKKAKDLIDAGWGGEFESEAYRTVSGQNENISVRLSDAFLKAVREDRDWGLVSRTSKDIVKKIRARDLWQKIVKASWACADPGVQFHQTIQRWHTCPKGGEIRASNPCSEYMFLDDSACNLASLNLTKFLSEDGDFDFSSFMHSARIMFIAQDIMVDMAGYPTEKIAQNSHDYRPLGLGVAGLGATLMRMGIPYDSDDARSWAGAITALTTGIAYRTSTEIAEFLGNFDGFAKNKIPMLKVIKKHQFDLVSLLWGEIPDGLFKLINGVWKDVLLRGQKFGFRNAQATVMAPTGTIGLVMDSDTTGIEPDFALIKTKKLSGGGEVKMVSSSLSIGLQRLHYTAEQIQEVMAHVEVNGSIIGAPHLSTDHIKVFHAAQEISPEAHLKMMVAIQPFISGAISKTINLPAESTEKNVEDIFWQAWELGLKSVSIYRDGSKATQPLNKKQKGVPVMDRGLPKCVDCGAPTELAGGCFRCVNCGSVIGCS